MTNARFPWMATPETVKLMGVLNEAGEARFVGGCVRDGLLSEGGDTADVIDIDIATTLRPEKTMAVLESANIRVVPTGIDHGTLTAVINHQPFEITTLRSDVSTDGRRATVAYTEDWEKDARRRDFTMNALYLSSDGTLFDPVGGLPDLEGRRVRFIGDPAERIKEDALRILRFLRFTARFSTSFDENGWAACLTLQDHLDHLSRERVWHELQRIMATPGAPSICERAAAGGMLERLHPAPSDIAIFAAAHGHAGGRPSPALGCAALWPDATGESLKARFKPSKAILEGFKNLRAAAQSLGEGMPLRAALYHFGRDAVRDGAILAKARAPALNVPDRAIIDTTTIPELPVRGGDFVAAGVEKGPGVRDALARFEALWVAADFPAEEPRINALMTAAMSE